MRITIGILFFLSGLFSQAQEKGTIRFFVDPGHNFEYVLDGSERLSEKNLELTTGEHRFVFWAPTREMVDTIIDIQEGAQSFYLRLPFSLGYKAHERRMEKFQKQIFFKKSLPALVSLGFLTWTVSSYSGYRKSFKELDDLRNSYAIETVPNQISVLKNDLIPKSKDEFKKKEIGLLIATGAFAASAIVTAYMWNKTSKIEAPIFDDKAKVEFDGLVYNFDNYGGHVSAGLSISLK